MHQDPPVVQQLAHSHPNQEQVLHQQHQQQQQQQQQQHAEHLIQRQAATQSEQDKLRVQLLLQQQLVQQQLAQQQQQPQQQPIQQVQPVHETVAEEHTSQLAHGEVHGVETQVNEEELVRAVEVTHSHPLAQKIHQQLIQPNSEGAEGSVAVENQFSRGDREKVSVSPHPVCPSAHPLPCTQASPPVHPIAPLFLPSDHS